MSTVSPTSPSTSPQTTPFQERLVLRIDGADQSAVAFRHRFRGEVLKAEGGRAIAAGLAPMEVRRGLDKAVAALVDELRRRSREITTEAETAQVGTISANGDAEIGRLIAGEPAREPVECVGVPQRLPDDLVSSTLRGNVH